VTAPVVIYHGGNCLDGFGSAYAAWRYFLMHSTTSRVPSAPPLNGTEPLFVAANHGEAPPDCRDRDVFILDFSYKRPVLGELCKTARRVVILDHHISAQEDLAGLDQVHDNLEVVFDMTRSGAAITWEYFHQEPLPHLLACVQDRDLWQFRIADSQHINSALASYPFDFAQWHQWALRGEALQDLIQEGRAINRYRDQMIALHADRAVIGEIAGYSVPIVNCPVAIVSELVGQLARDYPFAAGYTDKGCKRGWSLRSTAQGLNVADIAVRFGGGGHPRAAGFATAIPGDLLKLVP
jgi:uncharacterized protein